MKPTAYSLILGLVTWCAVPFSVCAEEPPAKDTEKTAFLNIRVVDEKGQPQTEAMVHLELSRNNVSLVAGKVGELGATFKCDGQGWATIGPFEPGDGYAGFVAFQKERYSGDAKRLEELVLQAGRNEHILPYTTPLGSSVSGVLLDRKGQPLDGVTVRFAPYGWCDNGDKIPACASMRCNPTCTTDAHGAFFFEGLEEGEDWAVVAVRGLDILFLGEPMQVPVAGKVNLGQIKTDIDRKDVKAGPD